MGLATQFVLENGPHLATLLFPLHFQSKKESFELFNYARLRTLHNDSCPVAFLKTAACFLRPEIFGSRTTEQIDMAWYYLLRKQSTDYSYPWLKKNTEEKVLLMRTMILQPSILLRCPRGPNQTTE